MSSLPPLGDDFEKPVRSDFEHAANIQWKRNEKGWALLEGVTCGSCGGRVTSCEPGAEPVHGSMVDHLSTFITTCHDLAWSVVDGVALLTVEQFKERHGEYPRQYAMRLQVDKNMSKKIDELHQGLMGRASESSMFITTSTADMPDWKPTGILDGQRKYWEPVALPPPDDVLIDWAKLWAPE